MIKCKNLNYLVKLWRTNILNLFQGDQGNHPVEILLEMHAIIDQLVPPNVINYSRKFSAKLAGDSFKSNFLACVKTNMIEVYILTENDVPLRLFSNHKFAARIESIEVLTKPENDSDFIFMTFSDCKVIIFNTRILLKKFLFLDDHF